MLKLSKPIFFGLILFLLVLSCAEANKREQSNPVNKQDEFAGEQPLIEKGMEISAATFKTLSSHLMATMKEKGPIEAIAYCNVAALPLTDSLSKAHKVSIKRTALKLRNPVNAPTDTETEVLNQFQASLEKGEAAKPLIKKLPNGKKAFYAPIMTMSLCLKCHGTPQKELAQKLQELYPEDQATGFKEGDLRGIWSITFDH